MAARLRILSKVLLNLYPELYFAIKGVKNTQFLADKGWKDLFIRKYNGNIDNFLLDGFPKIFWEKRAHWERLVKGIQDERFSRILQQLALDGRILMSVEEIYNLYKLVSKSERIGGDIAEVGVYKGGSAKLICEVKGNRRLHLFDTFEGMPRVTKDVDIITEGYLSDTSIEGVKTYLSGYINVFFYKGLFPDTAKTLEARTFSFVNLDVDIYSSTLSCLRFFYPRMEKGGFIISHDYLSFGTPGVKKAFDEFFGDKPEPVIELWTTQCLVIKT